MIQRFLRPSLTISTAMLIGLAVSGLAPWVGRPATSAPAGLQFAGGFCGFQGGFQGFQLGFQGFQGGFQGFQLGGGGCSFGAAGGFQGFNIGVPALLTPQTTVQVDQAVPILFLWEVPPPLTWQSLQSLEVRLRGNSGVLFLVRWDQANDTFSLIDPSTGQVVASGRAGGSGRLENQFAALDLGGTEVETSGATGTVVALLLNLRFKQAADGQSIQVEQRATSDQGEVQGFATVGTLTVASGRDDEDEKRLTEEQKQQKERTNNLGLDSAKAEGNVPYPPHCDEAVGPPVPGVPEWLTRRPGPWVLFVDRDGIKRGDLLFESRSRCRQIQAGDYVSGPGSQITDREFAFESLTIERGGRTVR